MVWPIVIPQIDWATFVRETMSVSGRSPTALLNAQREKVEGPAALLKAVSHLAGEKDVDLSHASMSFLIHATADIAVLMSMRTDLALAVSDPDFRRDGQVAIVASGTVRNWKEAFLNLCTPSRPQEVLEVFNDIYGYFEQVNLTQFFNFRKIERSAGVFTVEGGN